MSNEPKIHTWFYCPRCGEDSLFEPPAVVVVAVGEKVRCPKCGTIWEIAGLLEVMRSEG